MKTKIYLLLAVVLLAACSPQAETMPTPTNETAVNAPTSVVIRITATPRPATATPTPTITPTPSPTPLALDKIELEPVLIQSGDLPAGVSAAQVRSSLPDMFAGINEPDVAIFQQFEKGGDAAGGVAVLLYSKPAALQQAYDYQVDGMDINAATDGPTAGLSSIVRSVGVGDDQVEALVTEMRVSTSGFTLEMNEIVFSRCFALVHIRMTGGVGIAGITAYAERLDRRLVTAVC